MASSQLQYLVSSTWQPENNLIRLTLTDSLHNPMMLEAIIGNPENVREVAYERYAQVRLIDLNSNRIIFYGKVEVTKPSYTGYYGETVTITARDNLQELLKNTINEKAAYANNTYSSSVIEDIINGGSSNEFSAHAWPGNIGTSDTAKFKQSATNAGATKRLDRNLKKSNRNALRTIQDFALDDPQDGGNNLFGRDFYLDTEFNKVASDTSGVAQPDLHYFSRGAVPVTPQTKGLTLEFQGTPANQVLPAKPNYEFPRTSAEIVTKARVEWVTKTEDGSQVNEVTCILIHHGGASSGTFSAGGIITWDTNKTATIEKVHGNSLIISNNGNDTWLDTICGEEISDGTRTATVNAVNASTPGSIRENIKMDTELVVKGLELDEKSAVIDRALRILQQSGDEVIRGTIHVASGWPTHKISDTHTGGASTTTLTDSDATFLDNGIRIGDEVVNVTDSVTGLITGVTQTTITTSGSPSMSWANGDTYAVYVPNRAGHVVYTKGFPVSDIADQNALITRIVYEEGPGIQNAAMEIVLHVAGHVGEGLPKGNQTRTIRTGEDANFASPGQSGERDVSTLSWSYTGAFTSPTAHQVDWSGGTLTLSDKRTFTISAGNSGTIAASEYLYFDIDTPTVFISTPTITDVIGIDTLLIAKFTRATSGTVPEFVAFGTISTTLQIDGTGLSLPTDIRGWTTDQAFSSASATQVNWAAGTITLSDGSTTYSIGAGNTGTMSARTYIYIDPNVSTTAFQTTTTAATAVGSSKIMVATAQNSTSEAKFFVFSGAAAAKFSGPDIEANSIGANQITAGSITATQIDSNTITANEIVANTIDTGQLAAGAVEADIIDSNAVIADKIQAGAITAVKLESDLVLSTNMIAGNASPGARWVLNSSGITGYNSSNVAQVQLMTTASAVGGSIHVGGATTAAVLNVSGVSIIGNVTSALTLRASDTFGATIEGYMGMSADEVIIAATGISKDLKLLAPTTGSDIILDAAGDVVVDNDILPNTTDTYQLGNSNKVWEDCYVNDIRSINRIFPGASDLGIGSTMFPILDSAYSLGVQTSKQWANVWADLVNGSDIMIANKWRMLESELYEGYPEGWAVGHSEEWIDGKSLWKERDMIGKAKPTFVVTDDFIEYRGRKITVEKLDKLLSLVD